MSKKENKNLVYDIGKRIICDKLRLEKVSSDESNERRQAMDEKMEKILVAVDGSDHSERVLTEAKKQGEQGSKEIVILTVVDPIALGRYRYAELPELNYEVLENAGEAVLANALEVLEDLQGKVHTKLQKGSPADEILKEAEDGEYDLIIMGSRGYGAISESILGSVSHKVLNHTETNVFIIK